MFKYLYVIAKNPLFSDLPKESLVSTLENLGAREKSYEKNEYIFMEGDPVRYIGIMLSGSALIMQEDYFGNRTIIDMLQPPQMFAEAFACAGVAEMPVSVVADSDCAVLLIEKSRLLTGEPTLLKNLLTIVSRRNIFLNQKLRHISKKTTREMLLSYLTDQATLHNSAEFDIPFDRQGLADYLGVERSAMSSELGKLVREGLIETRRSHFILKR